MVCVQERIWVFKVHLPPPKTPSPPGAKRLIIYLNMKVDCGVFVGSFNIGSRLKSDFDFFFPFC